MPSWHAQGKIYLYLSNTFIVLGTYPDVCSKLQRQEETRLIKAVIKVDYEESIEVLQRKKTKQTYALDWLF
jgi:hypothetical protein